MSRELWVGDEAEMGAIARHVFARALRRPVLVLTIALLVTGAYVAVRVHQAPSYEATLYFQLTEGDFTDPNNPPRALRDIRQYISNVALSRTRVERLMNKYHLSRAYLARDRVSAIDDFREDIGIEVSRNYFIYDRVAFNEPRSAHVAISLQGSDPEQVRAIVGEIGDSILKDQVASRGARLRQARDLFAGQLALARARRKSLQETVDRLWLEVASAELGGGGGVRARAEIAAMQAQIKGAIEQVVILERRSAEAAFSSAAAEGNQLGLNFQLFDESQVTFAPHLTRLQITRLALIVFATVLLITIPLVGTFDDRIYAAEDLVARGLPLFGALPRFAGDDIGSYRKRLQAKRV